MKKIITNRLVLRNFCAEDAQGLLRYLSNPRVNCFLSEKITTQEEAALEAEKKSKDDSYVAVSLKDGRCLIGELFCLYEKPDTYFIGWHFNKQYEGKDTPVKVQRLYCNTSLKKKM